MSPVAYLLDENVDPALGRELQRRERGIAVLRVGDPAAPPAGTLDPDILLWCEAHGFVQVTNNRKSMPRHLRDHLAAEHHVPGIVVLNLNMSVGNTIADLQLIYLAGSGSEYEYADQLVFLPV